MLSFRKKNKVAGKKRDSNLSSVSGGRRVEKTEESGFCVFCFFLKLKRPCLQNPAR